jgi:hypothetical protein
MKYLKMLGLAAVAAMALTAFLGASSASATTLTCTNPPGTKVVCPKGTVIIASVEKTESATLTGGLTITCSEGEVNGSTSNEGSSTETVKGTTSAVTFVLSSCTNCTTVSVTNGSLEIHTDEEGVTNGNGTLTGSGFTAHLVCFGVTCNYSTGNNRDLGTVKGSSTTGGTATFKIGAELALDSGSSFLCGSGNATWEGSYVVTSPDWLDID